MGATNVLNFIDMAFVKNNVKGSCNIFDVQVISQVRAIALNRQRLVLKAQFDEFWNDLLWLLMRTLDVIASCNNDGHSKRSLVRFDEMFCCGFRGCIRICRLHRAAFMGRNAIQAVAIDFVRRNVHKFLNLALNHASTFQQCVCAQNIRFGEMQRISKGIVDVSLRRKVQNHINLKTLKNVLDQVCIINGAFDECVIGMLCQRIQIGIACTLLEFVKIHKHLVGLLARQQEKDMRSDKPRSACK